jgi:hypothetical protein
MTLTEEEKVILNLNQAEVRILASLSPKARDDYLRGMAAKHEEEGITG